MNLVDVGAQSGFLRPAVLGCTGACCLLVISTVVLILGLVRRNRKDPSGRRWFSLRDK